MRDGSTQKFVGQESNLRISGQNIMQNIMGWLFNQLMTLQQAYQNSDRQSQQLISGTNHATKAR